MYLTIKKIPNQIVLNQLQIKMNVSDRYMIKTVTFIVLGCLPWRTFQLVCPPAQYYRPCNCQSWGQDDVAWLFCFNLNLNDTKMSQILSSFLTNPSTSPLGAVTLNNNLLTTVPEEIRHFPQLVYINLSGNNIRSISTGAFQFRATADRVLLFENEISVIEPEAFQGEVHSMSIHSEVE